MWGRIEGREVTRASMKYCKVGVSGAFPPEKVCRFHTAVGLDIPPTSRFQAKFISTCHYMYISATSLLGLQKPPEATSESLKKQCASRD